MHEGRLPLRSDLEHHRHADRQYRPRAIASIASDNPATQCLDKTAADRQTEAGTSAAAILRLDPIKFVENPLELRRWDPLAPVDDFDLDKLSVARRVNIDLAADRRVLGSVVEEIEQHLLE